MVKLMEIELITLGCIIWIVHLHVYCQGAAAAGAVKIKPCAKPGAQNDVQLQTFAQ